MKKIIIIAVAIIAVATWWLLYPSPTHVIAIVTTLSHPALDSARDGAQQSLQQSFGDEVALRVYNAEGNVQQANLIAQKIASDKTIIGIITIGSLATMSVAKAEKIRPIVFTAVSDASILGTLADNVCGLTDAIDAAQHISVVTGLLPSVQRVALLYTPSEANAAAQVKNLHEQLLKAGLTSSLVGIHEPQQIMTASALACKNADAIIIPLDNQLVAAMPTVIKATRALPCAVVTSNESPIHQGAALALGIDYKKSGNDAGHLIADLIKNHGRAKDVGIIKPTHADVFVNDDVVREKQVMVHPHADITIIHVGAGVNHD